MSGGAPYLVPAASAEGEVREKGSRFLAVVSPAKDETEARRALAEAEARFPDATHRCWAWRLGSPAAERCADAGEPSGTAGQPILRALRGAGVSDAVAVVARWFGGTQLGKGGLSRAYAAAARRALEELPLARRVRRLRLEIEVGYDALGGVKRALRPPHVELVDERYGERATLVLEVAEGELVRLGEALAPLGVTLPHDPRDLP